MKNQLKTYLQNEPRARERVNKDRALINFLLLTNHFKKVDIDSLILDKENLIDFCHDFNSADRYWRMILAENPELQGRDYNTKKIVEDRKEIELGYEPGFNQDIKQYKLI